MRNTIALIAAAVFLAGCSSFGDPISEDTTAGRTKVAAGFYDPAGLPDACTKPMPKTITWYDGKDKSELSASLDMSKGTLTYAASDVRSTEPSDVRRALLEAWGDDTVEAIEGALPDGLQGLVSALKSAGLI